MTGTALMAKWSEEMPLTACVLTLTTAWVQISARAPEKVTSDLVLGITTLTNDHGLGQLGAWVSFGHPNPQKSPLRTPTFL